MTCLLLGVCALQKVLFLAAVALVLAPRCEQLARRVRSSPAYHVKCPEITLWWYGGKKLQHRPKSQCTVDDVLTCIVCHRTVVTQGKYCGGVVSWGSLWFVSANQKLKAVTGYEVGLSNLMVLQIILPDCPVALTVFRSEIYPKPDLLGYHTCLICKDSNPAANQESRRMDNKQVTWR